MKNIKRLFAAAISVALAVTCFAGCHKKNEIAVKIGDYSFTSGYYACALMYADTEAKNKIDDELKAKGKSTENVDYHSKKLEGKKYEKWVKDKAIDNLKINAGYMQLCKELKLELTDDNIETAKSFADNYWQYYGYDQIFGENGVSKETFTKYTTDTYYSEIYFSYVYGKEGTNPVTEEELKKTLDDNYALVYKLETDISSMEDDDVKTKEGNYELYLNQYKSGTSFEDIYIAENGAEETEETAEEGDTPIDTDDNSETADAAETSDAEQPADKRAELVGNEKTGNSSDLYSEVTKMAVGEAKIIETDTKLAFVVRLDIHSDAYYLNVNDETLRKLAVGDKSNDDARKRADKLGVKETASAVNQFKVKKLKYPESTTIG